MKKISQKLFLVGLPFIIFIGIPLYAFIASGEYFKRPDKIIVSNKKSLIGYTYNEDNYGYIKWEKLSANNKFEVVVLGSSRVLQFRAPMFQASFYNAGYTIAGVNDFLPFLQSLPADKYPRFLIIGLDQWMFNRAWDSLNKTTSRQYWKNLYTCLPGFDIFRKYWTDLLDGRRKIIFPRIDSLRRIGIAAYDNNGLRNDGSMQYGNQIVKLLNGDKSAMDFHFQNTLERIQQGKQRFEFGDDINQKAITSVALFLVYCKMHDINVIGFLPPFSETVYKTMLSTGRYKYLDKISPALSAVFKKCGNEFYNFSAIRLFGSGDGEVIDGFHGGELCYSKMLLAMLRERSVLNLVSDSTLLKRNIEKALNQYNVFN